MPKNLLFFDPDDDLGFFGPAIRPFIAPEIEPFDDDRDRDGGDFDEDEYWPEELALAA